MSEEFKKEEINGEAAEETKAAEHTEEVKAETTAEPVSYTHLTLPTKLEV